MLPRNLGNYLKQAQNGRRNRLKPCAQFSSEASTYHFPPLLVITDSRGLVEEGGHWGAVGIKLSKEKTDCTSPRPQELIQSRNENSKNP